MMVRRARIWGWLVAAQQLNKACLLRNAKASASPVMQHAANNNTQGQAVFPALVDPNLWRSSAQKYGFPMRM
jgi:hypothetical protein